MRFQEDLWPHLHPRLPLDRSTTLPTMLTMSPASSSAQQKPKNSSLPIGGSGGGGVSK